MNKEELLILQEIINEEILSYLESGYELTSSYINVLRGILKKLNLEETYNFEKMEEIKWQLNKYIII